MERSIIMWKKILIIFNPSPPQIDERGHFNDPYPCPFGLSIAPSPLFQDMYLFENHTLGGMIPSLIAF